MKGRVLVVDDSPMIRSYIRQVLSKQGYFVTEAINGSEGYEMAVGSPPDLIISDVNMPVLDGYAMVANLRRDHATIAVPIVMISTEAQARDANAAYAVGANCYLVKPLRPDVLTSMVGLLTGDSN
jgi:two-component system chemotaxis response regulator CheY